MMATKISSLSALSRSLAKESSQVVSRCNFSHIGAFCPDSRQVSSTSSSTIRRNTPLTTASAYIANPRKSNLRTTSLSRGLTPRFNKNTARFMSSTSTKIAHLIDNNKVRGNNKYCLRMYVGRLVD